MHTMLVKERIAIVIGIIVVILLAGSIFYYFSVAPSSQSSPFVIEFPTNPTAYPNAIAVDNNGRVWFSMWNETALGVLYPSNGTIKTFPLPEQSKGLQTWGIAVDNSKGLVWFTDADSNAVWSFNISTSKFLEYSIPTSDSFPYQLAIDHYGNVWFSESFAGMLGEITSLGVLKEYPIPQNGSNVDHTGLTVDNNDTVWFTEPNSNMIGSFRSGAFTILNMTGLIYSPVGIAVDNQGNIWVTQHTIPGLIAEFNPFTHSIKSISTSYSPLFGTSLPYFIYTDSQGNLWFNEHYGNAIARFNPSTGSLTEFHVPLKRPMPQTGNISGILTMTLSSNGTPWFTELFAGNIGMINASRPVSQKITVGNSQISVSSESSTMLSIQGSAHSSLAAYVGNFTSGLTFIFSPNNGSGNFSSTLTIQNNGAKAGVYFVTVSDATGPVTVSQVIKVTVT